MKDVKLAKSYEIIEHTNQRLYWLTISFHFAIGAW